jgi:amidohydrolase
MDSFPVKQAARERVERAHEALIGLSHWIHANPELGYEERMASGWVAEWLEKAGFEVARGWGGLETAVVGAFGPGPLNVALLVEYDALPEVGHACGHNVIAASSVGAGVALAAVAEHIGLRVTVIGTPAEEGGAGKQLLLDAGAFEGVHFSLMNHPGPNDQLLPDVLAAQSFDIAYTGVPSHAGAFPERGVNAADAMVIAQVGLGLLRQSLLPTDRVHGVVTVGGEAMNIIPARTEAKWMIRAASVERLDQVRSRVLSCFEAGGMASGAAIDVNPHTVYADMVHDRDLAELYRVNAEALGRSFIDTNGPVPPGVLEMTRFSTDMGNVSYAVPAIHPIIGIESAPAVNHQPEFTAAAASPAADQAVFDGSVALAWTAIDAALNEGIRNRLLSRSETY